MTQLSKEELIESIHWTYHGKVQGYIIYMGGIDVHFTQDKRQLDMFIAELKARIMLMKD